MKTYSPYHLHSSFSLLDSCGKLENYFKRAKELNLPSLSFSDHGNLHHVIDAYDLSKEYEIKYSAGIELYQARKTRFDKDDEERAAAATDELQQRGPLHLSAIAANGDGLNSLIKLSSEAYLNGQFVKPRVDFPLLEFYNDGLIILSGCLNGAVNQHLLRNDYDGAVETATQFQDIVGKDNYFIEVMLHGIEEETWVFKQLVQIAKTIDAKIIPTIDAHYVNKDDYLVHDISLCVSTGSRIHDEKRFRFHGDQFYLKSYEEMATLFPEEWLQNTLDLNDRIESLNLELKEFKFPKFDYDGDTYQLLYDLVQKGIRNRYGELTPIIEERLAYELGVIQRMGFVDYILIVWDIINWAHEQGILANARGSAGGSLVVYVLGITNVDPILYDLRFERFLIEGRISMPDIDIDVSEDRREEIINYLKLKYGSDRVVQICNFSTINSRSAIKDAARVLDIDYAYSDKLSKLVPPPIQGFYKTLQESLDTSDDLSKEYKENEDAQLIIKAALGLEGLVRQTGIHAAGTLVTPGPVINYVPVMQRQSKDAEPGPITTQWSGVQVEAQGLLKIDILGLRNYTIIDKTLRYLKQIRGLDLDIEKIPLDDEKTFDLLRRGNTETVFQMGSGGIKRLTQEIKPNSLEDISAIIALYRPGPLGSGMDKDFVNRKANQHDIKYLHPSLKANFETTYGLMIYQEQILDVAERLAGYSVMERDELRKVVGKKLKDKIPAFRTAFVNRSTEYSGISRPLANKIFDEIEYFGAYGFNKPHSLSYAFLAYQTAYLCANYPVEYMTAVISSAKDVDKIGEYVLDALRMGIKVLGPSINNSKAEFSIVNNDTLRYGFKSVAGLGIARIPYLTEANEPYQNIYDWLRRCHPELLNKALIEHLIYAGALDELVEEPKSKLIERQEKIDILSAELKELGTYITEHPLLGVWNSLEEKITHTIDSLYEEPSGSRVIIAGIVLSKIEKLTKNNKKILIFQIQDLTGTIEAVNFGGTKCNFNLLMPGDIIHLIAKLENNSEDDVRAAKLICYEYLKPELPQFSVGEPIILKLNRKPSDVFIRQAKELIEITPGDSYVIIEYMTKGYKLKYRFKKPTSLDLKLKLENLASEELN